MAMTQPMTLYVASVLEMSEAGSYFFNTAISFPWSNASGSLSSIPGR